MTMLLPQLPPPAEGIHHQSGSVDAYISDRCIGSGTIYIAESRLAWTKEGSNDGISLEYPNICVHAISRDAESFQHPCLYLMLDINVDETGVNNEPGDSDEEGDDENSSMTEIRFVPRDPFLLEPMYKALNECQVLHPDPEQVESDDGIGEEDDDEGHYDVVDEGDEADSGAYEENMEDGLTQHSLNGHNDDDNDDMETGQFEDAERR